ncbi:MAG: DNA polymerase/3'-5' exonuclease PolX [Candidatus Hydrogenedentes bacterium]|nr:DNA polymerase/3'-5' exonuclease PolX [Candidatus Hydrogenedentota bacterium]
MDKKDIIGVLEEIALLLELSGENPFKARSYTNVARQIEQLEEELDVLVAGKRLREIKGVGDALEKKIEELVTTGSLKYYEDLRAKFPASLFALFRVPGLGAKRIKTLYEELGVQSLGELEYACTENRLVGLKGFGPKMQDKVLQGIAFAKRHEDLHLISTAMAEAERLRDWLAQEESIVRIDVAGSIRRRKEVVKDIDLLASSARPEDVMGRFVAAEGVERETGQGDTKSSVVLESGLAADLRVVSDEEFPYALHHFTGSKDHNVAMRQRAKERGLKMNEYGLFRGDENIACADEAAIFAELGLPYIPPELREDMGELEAAELPRLVEQGDLVGVYHCHSTYSDGRATVGQMAEAARSRGYQYLVIADHSQSAAYAGGLSPAAVEKQHAEIDALNAGLDGFRVLKGIESDIRTDGRLDYEDDVLGAFDAVIASIHSKLDMKEEEATTRVIRAVENRHTAILGHPTGRLLLSRAGYALDFDRVFDACRANGVAVEINANPHRLDLDWRQVRRAKERGVMLCIGPDAHSTDGLDDVAYGLGVARKGWLEADDLLNAMTVKEFFAWRR